MFFNRSVAKTNLSVLTMLDLSIYSYVLTFQKLGWLWFCLFFCLFSSPTFTLKSSNAHKRHQLYYASLETALGLSVPQLCTTPSLSLERWAADGWIQKETPSLMWCKSHHLMLSPKPPAPSPGPPVQPLSCFLSSLCPHLTRGVCLSCCFLCPQCFALPPAPQLCVCFRSQLPELGKSALHCFMGRSPDNTTFKSAVGLVLIALILRLIFNLSVAF